MDELFFVWPESAAMLLHALELCVVVAAILHLMYALHCDGNKFQSHGNSSTSFGQEPIKGANTKQQTTENDTNNSNISTGSINTHIASSTKAVRQWLLQNYIYV